MAQQWSGDITYARENEIIAHYRTILQQQELSSEEKTKIITEISDHYERLLDDQKLLVSVGDRLQRKLKSANLMLREQAEEIKRINSTLENKNNELQVTVDELTRVRASRRASTIVLTIAIISFIISELIQQYFENYTANSSYGIYLSWGFKLALVFAFKPLETFFEKMFLQRAKRRSADEALGQIAALRGANGDGPPPVAVSVAAGSPASVARQ